MEFIDITVNPLDVIELVGMVAFVIIITWAYSPDT